MTRRGDDLDVMAIFNEALDQPSPAARSAYLARACGGDHLVRARVETLLLAHERSKGFLESPAYAATGDIARHTLIEGPGTVIGPYKLLEKIGEGGMGVVYMAEQSVPMRRKVALKIIKPGMDTRQVIARFEAERQALAMMEHPNIARVLDGGTTGEVAGGGWRVAGKEENEAFSPSTHHAPPATASGRPYFVMELVRGIPITEYCDQERLSIDDRLDLFALVCQAVQHAHQKGIIHRDIKPSNVLITLHDGVPVPKVIDFGIAKATGQQSLTEKTLFTGFAQLIGTPLYMSPEQAALSGIEVDARCDIYSLGVLLYELLTGMTPFDQETFRMAAVDEVWRMIREEDPPAPSSRLMSLGATQTAVSVNRRSDPRRLNRSLRGELDWIVMKALEKDRGRRYETAGAFAADIERYRKHLPVEAGPPSAWYRGRRFARRHRLALTTTVILALSITLVGGIWVWSAVSVDRARRAAAQSRTELNRRVAEARRHRYVVDIRQAHELVQAGRGHDARELLKKWQPAPGEEEVRNFAWYYLRRLCHGEKRTLHGHEGPVFCADFSPDGRTLVSCGKDRTVRFWDVSTGRLLRTITVSSDEVDAVAFSPDGRTVVTGGDDGQVQLWDVATGNRLATIAAHKGPAGAGFSRDGRRLISGGQYDHLIKIWEVKTHQLLSSRKVTDNGLNSGVLSPDGTTLATAGGDGYVRLWNVADLTPKKSLRAGDLLYGLAFSADGTRIAAADGGGRAVVWDIKTGQPRPGFNAVTHVDDVQAVAFLAGDRMLVSADGRGNLWLSDASTGNRLATLSGHAAKIWGLSVSPDGMTLATTSSDETVKLWDARLPQRWLAIPVPNGGGPIAFTPDGQTLVAADAVGGRIFEPGRGGPGHAVGAELELSGFDPNTGARRFHQVVPRQQNPLYYYLTADGAHALYAEPGPTATMWEVASGKRLATLNNFVALKPVGAGFGGFWAQGGPFELVDSVTGERRVLDGTEGTFVVTSARQAPLLALGTARELAIFDGAATRMKRRRSGIDAGWSAAAFSPDATILATAATTPHGLIQLWDVSTLKLLDSLPGHSANVSELDFSPDGKVLASVSGDGAVKLWDVAARAELLALRGPFQPQSSIRFAPDGRSLAFRATAGAKGWIYLLQTTLPDDVNSEGGP
ncbi:MAG: WD40 repeat domain-containing serine/threonine-protein kinase [Isosphaeraceae bacterium]